MPIHLSIVIVSWNTCELLAACLDSVYAHPPRGDFEVLVVDNASQDGSATMVRRAFPQARLLENETNVGFARANNQAIEISQGQHILLLNSDTEVLPDALDVMLQFMDAHPQAGVAGARLLNPDGTLQNSCSPFPTLGREAWRLAHGDCLRPLSVYPMHDWDVTTPQAVDVLLGACLLVRRRALDQVGWLDVSYFMYSEEVDLCLRIKQAGWSIAWVPAAQVIHSGGQSSKQVAKEMFLQLYRSKTLYFRKRHSRASAASYKMILGVAAVVRILATPVAKLAHADRRADYGTLQRYYRELLRQLPSF